MKLIASSLLIALFLLPQMSHAKVQKVFGEVLLTEVDANSQKYWYRVGHDKSEPVMKYPIELARSKIQGCTVLSFDITEAGNTANVEVISSIPNKHLGKYAKNEVKSWRWQQADSLSTVIGEKRTIRLDYCLGTESAASSQAQCQRQAQLNCS
ncbi:hypothetical protein TUM4438_23860 [Shewanella sairae]|uniref:TonB C-terminal domain-containing protein n=1 Tax=Shewanella sairae TaxID=190310 RepID=A0ABQ4PH58_9GAMM|nr:energy transducer TonB [Shewanella sairae]MCL1131242.1 energy transducer TonB [Shewanella sairae]GIU46849.1 hypothetical protein TUM4438_23860 [Shewanella sairae]